MHPSAAIQPAGEHDHRTSHEPPRRPFEHHLKAPSPRRTGPFTWFAAIFCALLWAVIILGGLTVLIIYLVFRPRSPRLAISGATLNSAYLDMDAVAGTLLNADVTILANFSNPNSRVGISFGVMELDLYFMGTLIATQGVEHFAESPGQATLRSLHMVTSEVALSPGEVEAWRKQVAGNGVQLDVRGLFRTRSDLGPLLHFSYWLYSQCRIVLSAPPGGALLSSSCITKT